MPNETNEAAYRRHMQAQSDALAVSNGRARGRSLDQAPKVGRMANALTALARKLAAVRDVDDVERIQREARESEALAPVVDWLEDEVFWYILTDV